MVAAIDVGGTSIKSALVGRGGERYAESTSATGRLFGPSQVLERIAATAARLVEAPPSGTFVRGVGVVVPGTVDAISGVARFAANIGWRDAPLAQFVSRRVDLPVALGHDVRSAALAEARLGAGLSDDSVFLVSIGTGVAAGYARGGRVDDGANGLAGEFGHIVVRPGGPGCGCGNHGCLEVFAAASRIGARYSNLIGHQVSARHVAALVAAKDAAAQSIWADAVEALADGLAIVVTILDPGSIVIGGGLSLAGETLLQPLRLALAKRLTFRSAPPVVATSLGDRAGLLGAALRAWDLLDGRTGPGR